MLLTDAFDIQCDAFRIKVWPGFRTATGRYNGGVMLMADVDHKVLQTETVHKRIRDIKDDRRNKRQDDFRKACRNELVGRIVTTK